MPLSGGGRETEAEPRVWWSLEALTPKDLCPPGCSVGCRSACLLETPVLGEMSPIWSVLYSTWSRLVHFVGGQEGLIDSCYLQPPLRPQNCPTHNCIAEDQGQNADGGSLSGHLAAPPGTPLASNLPQSSNFVLGRFGGT